MYEKEKAAAAPKAAENARRSIGEKFRVRTGKNSVVEGTIVSAEVVNIYVSGRSVRAQYNVVMECGADKVRRSFLVGAVPVSR